jgi:putative ABC transport system substrate-binding protein
MRRREFITFLGSVAAWPIAARAQQPDRMRLIGVLMAYVQNDPTAQSWLAAFRAALAKLGWTEGSNLRIELRWSAADADTMRTLAKELVDLRPNAIFGVTTQAIGAQPARRRQFRSCSRAYLIRSAVASLRTLRIRAVTSLASCPTIRRAH